jgi:hypothetical protein
MTRHQVILIRPWDMSDGVGAGCCSGGSTKGLCVDPAHHPAPSGTPFIERATWQPLAGVYLALRDGLPSDVDVEIVDPRNHLYLVPVLMRAARRRGLGWWGALLAALRAPGYAAIIVDGQVVSRGELPDPDRALRLVQDVLGAQRA